MLYQANSLLFILHNLLKNLLRPIFEETAPDMNCFEVVKSESPYYQEVIRYYKTNPCPTTQPQKTLKEKAFGNNCINSSCYYYHDYQERRRPLFEEITHELLYEPALCPSFFQLGQCVNGDMCGYAHTQNEINYHALYYKTKPCEECYFHKVPKLCPKFHSDEISRVFILNNIGLKKDKESSGRKSSDDIGPKNFNLDSFKTKACAVKGNHNPKICISYHFENDRRRPTSVFNYSPDMCSYVKENIICPHGDDCQYSHNKVEQLYHPEKYKRKFCTFHPQKIHKCDYGEYCSFAHSEDEIQIELLHNLKKDVEFYVYKYKTVFCPYIYEHNRIQCVYAHNPQDFRRSPALYHYVPYQCPNWYQKQIFSYGEGRCPKQMDCENCHGWKELEYHPLNYKQKSCNNDPNCTKVECPYLHSNKEPQGKRTFPSKFENQSLGMVNNFGVISPPNQKFYHGSSDKSEFYDQFRPKNEKRIESNYMGPIKPLQMQSEMFHKHFEKDTPFGYGLGKFEESTRPSSNVSSKAHLEEGVPKQVSKNRKKKQMSFQNKNEAGNFSSPDSTIFERKSGKRFNSANIVSTETQSADSLERTNEQLSNQQKSRKSSGMQERDSFDSLHGEDLTISKAFEKLSLDQFKYKLSHAFQKEGFEDLVPMLTIKLPTLERLKAFSQTDFHLFPELHLEDKERVVNIIKKIQKEDQKQAIHAADGLLSSTSDFKTTVGEKSIGWKI